MNTTQNPPTTPETQQVTLFYREGASDKVYQAALEPQGEGFIVRFAFGRRGATLSTGTKTARPIDYKSARRLYDQLVKEKLAKGYSPGEDGTPYRNAEHPSQSTGILPQLLNPVEEAQLPSLLANPAYCAQEKLDGRRLLIRKQGDSVTGINRTGLSVGLPESLLQAASKLPIDFLLDGEAIGDRLHAFDLLECGGENFRIASYLERYRTLYDLLYHARHRSLVAVPCEWTPPAKARLLDQLKAQGKEGIVFKNIHAPYTPGRPASGGSQLKHKFYATASALVHRVNGRRSVELRLHTGREWVSAGNVTIPASHPVPQPGAIIDLRYLYAFRESGAFYQPTYLGQRDDLRPEECNTAQLKYKAAEGGEEG